MRILIADEDEITASVLKDIISDMGYPIESARDAQEVLSVFENFDVIIMDWQMPHYSSIEVIKKIRETHPDYPPYIIMLTSFGDFQEREVALKAGANSFLDKREGDPTKLKALLDFGCKSVERFKEDQEET